MANPYATPNVNTEPQEHTRRPTVKLLPLVATGFGIALVSALLTLSVAPRTLEDSGSGAIVALVFGLHIASVSVLSVLVVAMMRWGLRRPSRGTLALIPIASFLVPAFGVLCTSAIFTQDQYSAGDRFRTFVFMNCQAVPICYIGSLVIGSILSYRTRIYGAKSGEPSDAPESPSRAF